jgi:hypothetical protein
MPSPIYSLATLAEQLGKDPLYIRNLQRSLNLKSDSKATYSDSYLHFLAKIIALKTMGVSQEQIVDLFEMEKKILKLLHIDTLSASETWFLCDRDANGGLLLTGHDVGFAVDGAGVQDMLDFGAKEKEMFRGVEMGEDVRRILGQYMKERDSVVAKVQREMPVVRNALALAEKMVGRKNKQKH